MAIRLRSLAAGILSAMALALGGCASTYFHHADPPPAPIRHELGSLPFSEYWTGIVFNGEKIGFTRFTIRRAAGEPVRYEIKSEASFVLRFLGIEKKVNLNARDVVGADLEVVEFTYDYRIDDSELKVTGRRERVELAATVVSGGKPTEQRLPIVGKLYPSSVIALYPAVHGLALGREYGYRVYSGELQALLDVTQRVAAHERSSLFEGDAFKIETTMSGKRVTTWIDHQGRPVFELALHGAMISALEDAAAARRYVALASLNKQESLVEFSLVRPDVPIGNPRAVSALKVMLRGIDRLPLTGAGQRCSPSGQAFACEMRRAGRDSASPAAEPPPERYLQPSLTVQSRDPSIRRVADEIAAGGATPRERIARILRWLQTNVEKAPLDVFSALDVLQQRKAECQGHAYLYTAFARAVGIPTRIVNGLVYSEEFQGFLYHSWAESLADGNWIAVDPTFGQTAADATHIKLLEGENLADLMPLIDWVGKLKLSVLEVEH